MEGTKHKTARIPADRVKLAPRRVVPAQADPPGTRSGGPGIAVRPVTEGEAIRRILIACACGRSTEVQCVYEGEEP